MGQQYTAVNCPKCGLGFAMDSSRPHHVPNHVCQPVPEWDHSIIYQEGDKAVWRGRLITFGPQVTNVIKKLEEPIEYPDILKALDELDKGFSIGPSSKQEVLFYVRMLIERAKMIRSLK